MTNAQSRWIGLGVAVLALVVLFGAYALHAKANPLDLNQSNTTATTTLSFIAASTGSATYTYDSYNGGAADPNAIDNAALLVQLTASSTSSVLTWKYQFSQNGIDWYDDNTSPLATTSPVTNVTTGQTYSWTAPGIVTVGKVVILPATPTRYVRVVFTATGANASVWATFMAQKQQPE